MALFKSQNIWPLSIGFTVEFDRFDRKVLNFKTVDLLISGWLFDTPHAVSLNTNKPTFIGQSRVQP